MGFELDPDYKDVPTRIADFKELYPDGALRPANPDEPYRIEAISGQFFVVAVAAAYRGPDDTLPGIGMAWEPFPGKTPYTRDSELQNAETSAWGRAIVAALASESKAVASAEDVRNRRADAAEPVPILPDGYVWAAAAQNDVLEVVGKDKDLAAKAWEPKPEVIVINGAKAITTDAANEALGRAHELEVGAAEAGAADAADAVAAEQQDMAYGGEP